jgi:hypothetical protein
VRARNISILHNSSSKFTNTHYFCPASDAIQGITSGNLSNLLIFSGINNAWHPPPPPPKNKDNLPLVFHHDTLRGIIVYTVMTPRPKLPRGDFKICPVSIAISKKLIKTPERKKRD